DVDCNIFSDIPANADGIVDQINYLYRLGGNCGITPSCTRVSCSYDNSVYACSRTGGDTAPECARIADGASAILGRCTRGGKVWGNDAEHARLHIHTLLDILVHGSADALLDRMHELDVALADEGDGGAVAAGTGGSTHAVDVVVRVAGEVVVDDEADGGDVETAGGDVGGDEDAGGAGAEAREVVGAVGMLES
ncbi:hypothetical protein D0860_04082, partial [Hortaea werneckii]